MPNESGWYDVVKRVFYEVLCSAFQVDPDSQEALNRFIPAYEEETIIPQAPRNLNVTYYAIGNFQGDSGFDYIMIKEKMVNDKPKVEIRKTVPSSVLVTFYGPNADNDAEMFWSMFQWDGGKGSPRDIMRENNIVPIGKPQRPVSLYEVEGTYQRRRSDVRVDLAYYDVQVRDGNEVTSMPDIVTVSQNNG